MIPPQTHKHTHTHTHTLSLSLSLSLCLSLALTHTYTPSACSDSGRGRAGPACRSLPVPYMATQGQRPGRLLQLAACREPERDGEHKPATSSSAASPALGNPDATRRLMCRWTGKGRQGGPNAASQWENQQDAESSSTLETGVVYLIAVAEEREAANRRAA
ncbi:hypothetical protein K431DRAFT_25715 [Polychaeton citri CBS 116435]|uniref:Ig-like domain-containing protein n=1 Tax=Polychaeton citri CBS 116435 TaxID=1314669 RepID=A0A9P4Q161_9PEZI|nr:hypothetical protein K431DRAFT_25715 [Polychaeton citri CBS 116435]